MKYTFFLFITLLVMTGGAFGQTVTELQTKAKELKINKEITIGYDKFSDKSTISTKPYNLIGGGEGFAAAMINGMSRSRYGSGDMNLTTVLMISVFHQFSGEKLSEIPDNFAVIFVNGSPDWTFLKGDKNLYILFDEKRLQIEPKAKDGDVKRSGVIEELGYVMTREQLKQITQAKSVEIRLGNSLPRKIKPELLSRLGKLLTITELT